MFFQLQVFRGMEIQCRTFLFLTLFAFVIYSLYLIVKLSNMKKGIFGLAAVAAFSFNMRVAKEIPQMPGAYKMLSQVVNDGKRDTAYGGVKQLKIYTTDYVMYANVSTTDSVSSFGIGTYTTNEGKVTEHMIYGGSDTSISTKPVSYTLDILKTANGYKQVIPDIVVTAAGQKFKLTEEYENVSSPAKSPLDGAWKLVKAYGISGNDTIVFQLEQFKTFYAGYVIWGRTNKDSTNANRTSIGCATFSMNGNNKLKESFILSTYSTLNGQTLEHDITMSGNDEYQQTISYQQGQKSVERYQRLKK
ncbi:MAG: hypothetical protein JWQ40_1262 [Segetibacter sp.]|nr:hypothetical protein [Segetibacter sp.]